ncbi:MAG: AI-2E family transporter [Eggerthellaceae bacterium]
MQKEDLFARRILTFVVWLFALWLIVHYWDQAMALLGGIFSALAPLIIGFAIAYVVNILMVPIEGKLGGLIKNPKGKKALRPLSMLLSFVLLIGIFVAIFSLVIPKMASCFEVLARQIQDMTSFLMPYLSQWLSPDVLGQFDMQNMVKNGIKWLLSLADGTLNNFIAGAGAFFSSTVNILIAIVLSVYLLSGKERLLSQLSILMDAYLPVALRKKIRYVTGMTNRCFHNYIVGQSVEAVILGTLCAIGMAILQMPYSAMIGCVVGATALIPFVGAYIGAAVGAVLIFTVSPIKALFFLIFLVVLQQIESNLIYPHVVGSSIGLPGMWVLIAIAIGGSFGGIVGIVLSVPIMATIYHLAKEGTAKRRAQVLVERAQAEAQAQEADGSAQEGSSDGEGDSAGLAVDSSQVGVDARTAVDRPVSQAAPGGSCSGDGGSGDGVREGDDASEGQKGTLFDQLLDAAAALGSSIGLSSKGKK